MCKLAMPLLATLLLIAGPAAAETVLLYWNSAALDDGTEDRIGCRLNGSALPALEEGRYLELNLPAGTYLLACRGPLHTSQSALRLEGKPTLIYLGLRPSPDGLEIFPDPLPPVTFPLGLHRVELHAGL